MNYYETLFRAKLGSFTVSGSFSVSVKSKIIEIVTWLRYLTALQIIPLISISDALVHCKLMRFSLKCDGKLFHKILWLWMRIFLCLAKHPDKPIGLYMYRSLSYPTVLCYKFFNDNCSFAGGACKSWWLSGKTFCIHFIRKCFGRLAAVYPVVSIDSISTVSI